MFKELSAIETLEDIAALAEKFERLSDNNDMAVVMNRDDVYAIVWDGIGNFEDEEFEKAVEQTSCIGLNCFEYLNKLADSIDKNRTNLTK